MKKKKELIKLAKLMNEISPERLEQVFTENKTLVIKLSDLDREDVKRIAKRFKLTPGNYLLQLHHLIREQLDNLS